MTLCSFAILEVLQGSADAARRDWRDGAAILREVRDATALEERVVEMRGACAKSGIPPLEPQPTC